MKIKPVGHALSLLIAISFLICIGWGLVMPASLHMHGAWENWLPGFEFLTPQGFIIGLSESYLYGWYIALVFVPLYRFFNRSTVSNS
ncbi:MAG: hypothetical protein Hens3KO_04000 [Henriciella sp.]|jgi:hypothetical protein